MPRSDDDDEYDDWFDPYPMEIFALTSNKKSRKLHMKQAIISDPNK